MSSQNQDGPALFTEPAQSAEDYLAINLPDSHGMPTTAQVAGFAEAEDALLRSMGGTTEAEHGGVDDGLGLPSLPAAPHGEQHNHHNQHKRTGSSATQGLERLDTFVQGNNTTSHHTQAQSAIVAPPAWHAFVGAQTGPQARSNSVNAIRGHGASGSQDLTAINRSSDGINFADFTFTQQPHGYLPLPENSFQGIPTSITVPSDQQRFQQQQGVDPLQPANWTHFPYNPDSNANGAPPKLSLDTSSFDAQEYQQHRRDFGSVSSISSQSSYASFSDHEEHDPFHQGLNSTSSSSEFSNLFTPATANGQSQLGVIGQLQDMTVHSRSASMVSLDRSGKKKTPYSRSKSGSDQLRKRTSTSSLSEHFDGNSMIVRGSPRRKGPPRGGLVRQSSSASFQSDSVDELAEESGQDSGHNLGGEEGEAEDEEEQPGGDNYKAPISRYAGPLGAYGEDLQASHNGPYTYLRSGGARDAEVDQMLFDLGKVADQMRSNAARDKARTDWSQKWLVLSYDHWDNCSVNRQGLYRAYTESCAAFNMKPLNTASFGKLIKAAFNNKDVNIRRLGNRSCSKYHYCGLRPITKRQVDLLNQYTPQSNGIWYDVPEGTIACRTDRQIILGNDRLEGTTMSFDELRQQSTSALSASLSADSGLADLKTPTPNGGFHAGSAKASERGRLPRVGRVKQEDVDEIELDKIQYFPSIDTIGDKHLAFQDRLPQAEAAWAAVMGHLGRLLAYIKAYRFDSFEMECRQFWSQADIDRAIFSHPTMMHLVGTADAVVYDEIFTSLSANFLGTLPPSTQMGMKSLGEKMEKIMVESLVQYDSAFFDRKIESAARFGHLLRHYHDILQTTASLKIIMCKADQVKAMKQAAHHDIQWAVILDQAALVLDIHPNALEQTFVTTLQAVLTRSSDAFCQGMGSKNNGNAAVLDLSIWASGVAETFLTDQRFSDGGDLKGMLVKFCWLTTHVVRDMTLRSDPNFGLFQMLKVFVDDWVALLVLRRTSLSDASVSSSVSNPVPAEFAGPAEVYSFEQQGFPAQPFAGPAPTQLFDGSNPMDTTTPSANNQYFAANRDSSQSAAEYSAMAAGWVQTHGPPYP